MSAHSPVKPKEEQVYADACIAPPPSFKGEGEGDVEIEPLSGKPFFHVPMAKSHVCSPYQLVLPRKFSRILPLKTISVILLHGDRCWETSYCGDTRTHKRFDPQWKVFAIDNKLKIGDICVFELMKCEDTIIKMKVQVLRCYFPNILLGNQDGTPDHPFVIDDD